MTEDIDFEGVVRQLQEENEQLRLNLHTAYHKAAPNMLKAIDFVQDHYIFFMIAGLWFALMLAFFDHIRERESDA